MAYDVFISYSSKNPEVAQAICHILEEQCIRCWMAPRNIQPGRDYGDMIDEAIVKCKVFLFIYSCDSVNSVWCKGELNVAYSENKIIIPYRIDMTPMKGAVRVMLNRFHWLDAYPDYKSQFAKLVETVNHAIGKTGDSSSSKKICKAVATYNVGDYYDDGNKQGVVFLVTDGGRHGKIVSLDQTMCEWSMDIDSCSGDCNKEIGALSSKDGLYNNYKIREIVDWENNYPAFRWCAKKGLDWYLPSIEDLELLLLNDQTLELVNSTMKEKAMVGLFGRGCNAFYWSSTEHNGYKGTCAKVVYMRNGNVINYDKSFGNYVRAISNF